MFLFHQYKLLSLFLLILIIVFIDCFIDLFYSFRNLNLLLTHQIILSINPKAF